MNPLRVQNRFRLSSFGTFLNPPVNHMKSVLSLGEIRSAALAMREKIQALKVSYQHTVIPTEAEKEMRPARIPARDERGTFAMKGTLQSSTREGVEDGKPSNIRYVIDSSHVVFKREGDRAASVARTDSEDIWTALGSLETRVPYCLMADIQYSASDRYAGQSMGFPKLFSYSRLGLRVREQQEKVAQRWCHVIEHATDWGGGVGEIRDGETGEFYWVDSDNPAILVKRESCFTLDGQFIPWWIRTFDSFRDLGDGVWLPMQIKSQGFSMPTSSAAPGTLVSEATCSVTDIKLNDEVTAEDFEFGVRKGEGVRTWQIGQPSIEVLSSSDNDQRIQMPLDQSANDELKRAIAEKYPAFFSRPST